MMEQDENSESRIQNPEGNVGAALGGNLEPRIENLEGTGGVALSQHSNSSAELRSADPFFSGRKHFPELDGLRGIAILLVLATHYQMAIPAHTAAERALKNILAHGWAGVDLFFVLSGFLITGILYDSKGQSNYFRNFYGRRTLRIFPLYYGFLAVVLIGLIATATARHWNPSLPQFRNLWSLQPWLWTYTFNIACALGHGSAHLGQLWSLSVEEQFYLVWPLVICFFPRRLLVPTCVTLIIGALALRILLFCYAPLIRVTHVGTSSRRGKKQITNGQTR